MEPGDAFFDDVLALLLEADADAYPIHLAIQPASPHLSLTAHKDEADDQRPVDVHADGDFEPELEPPAAVQTNQQVQRQLLLAPPSTSVRQDAVAVLPTRKKRKNAYRERLKDELSGLRRRAFELEGELRALQLRRDARSEPPPIVHVWKRIAQQHREARTAAQQQNRLLQSAVARQAMLLNELEQMLRANPDSVPLNTNRMQLVQHRQRRRKPVEMRDEDLLAAYLQQLDNAYSVTNQAFHSSGLNLDSNEPSLLVVRSRMCGSVEYFESCQSTVVPVDFQHVRQDAFRIFASLYPNRSRLNIPDDTLIGKFDVPGKKYDLGINFAIKWFDEVRRVVLVWRSLTIGDGEFSGMNADETGWLILQPRHQVSSLPGAMAASTILHSCVQIVPAFSVAPSAARAKQFTEAIMRCGDEDILTISQVLEEILMRDVTPDDMREPAVLEA